MNYINWYLNLHSTYYSQFPKYGWILIPIFIDYLIIVWLTANFLNIFKLNRWASRTVDWFFDDGTNISWIWPVILFIIFYKIIKFVVEITLMPSVLINDFTSRFFNMFKHGVKCPNCKIMNNEKSRFCSGCGNKTRDDLFDSGMGY